MGACISRVLYAVSVLSPQFLDHLPKPEGISLSRCFEPRTTPRAIKLRRSEFPLGVTDSLCLPRARLVVCVGDHLAVSERVVMLALAIVDDSNEAISQ